MRAWSVAAEAALGGNWNPKRGQSWGRVLSHMGLIPLLGSWSLPCCCPQSQLAGGLADRDVVC